MTKDLEDINNKNSLSSQISLELNKLKSENDNEKKNRNSKLLMSSSNDNNIALSIENLEEIRMKAASMSLPLLTALCSDKSLLRSLNQSNVQDK